MLKTINSMALWSPAMPQSSPLSQLIAPLSSSFAPSPRTRHCPGSRVEHLVRARWPPIPQRSCRVPRGVDQVLESPVHMSILRALERR
jgi:hypothetical protein